MMTLPDESMGAIYREHVAPNLRPASTSRSRTASTSTSA
jgi:hypothetical protein